MSQTAFRPVRHLFPSLLFCLLLLPASGCSLLSGQDETLTEETQAQQDYTSVLEEEVQDLQRRVQVLESRLTPVAPAAPAQQSAPAPLKTNGTGA